MVLWVIENICPLTLMGGDILDTSGPLEFGVRFAGLSVFVYGAI